MVECLTEGRRYAGVSKITGWKYTGFDRFEALQIMIRETTWGSGSESIWGSYDGGGGYCFSKIS